MLAQKQGKKNNKASFTNTTT